MMRYKLFGVLLLLLLGMTRAASAADFDHSHQAFESILKDVVVFKQHQSYVDYAKLKQNPAPLKAYTATVQQVSQQQFDRWSEAQQLAFLINAYNALTLELILTGYPKIESIKDLGNFVFHSLG